MERLSVELVLKEVSKSPSIEALRNYRSQLHEELHGHLLFLHPLEWSREVNLFHDAVIRRVIELAIAEMAAQGFGSPPVPFAFLLFGSGGRGEQTLWSDQDNGLVYADADSPEEQADREAYFLELSKQVASGLERAGYPPCSGEVVCTNGQWRKSISAYAEMVRGWLRDPHWEHVRYLLIAEDVRTIFGDVSFGTGLREIIHDAVRKQPTMLEYMLHNTLYHKVSLGVFGQLIKERYGIDAGGVDIKYGAYIPMVNGIRLLAIEAGIHSSSTEERIERLVSGGHIEEEIGEDWLEALSIALKLRSMTPYQIENGQYTTRGKLSADLLTKERVSELKLCLRVGMELQRYVKKSIQKEIEKG